MARTSTSPDRRYPDPCLHPDLLAGHPCESCCTVWSQLRCVLQAAGSRAESSDGRVGRHPQGDPDRDGGVWLQRELVPEREHVQPARAAAAGAPDSPRARSLSAAALSPVLSPRRSCRSRAVLLVLQAGSSGRTTPTTFSRTGMGWWMMTARSARCWRPPPTLTRASLLRRLRRLVLCPPAPALRCRRGVACLRRSRRRARFLSARVASRWAWATRHSRSSSARTHIIDAPPKANDPTGCGKINGDYVSFPNLRARPVANLKRRRRLRTSTRTTVSALRATLRSQRPRSRTWSTKLLIRRIGRSAGGWASRSRTTRLRCL